MNFSKLLVVGLSCLPFSVLAGVQSFYCPQNHAYINVGMPSSQVLAACGHPLSQQQSNQPITQRVPVQQLIYNNAGAPSVFYGVWAIPTGTSTGTQLQVDVVNNKVKSINVNGSGSNAFSVCGGTSIERGDPVSKVYGACGSPSVVNNTFVNQPILSNQKTEIWIYQLGNYQSPITLTFVNDKLQSID